MVITMAKLRMAHASTHGARKPPGPKIFFSCTYLLVMPKYWVKNYFAHGRFPEVGQKQKTEERERKKERLNDGDNNGQATHGARKHAWSTQAAWANIILIFNTPGTAGGPGGRDRTLAVKSRKNVRKITYFS